jgi:DNA-binding CsgD family transcriptional regulator
VSAAEVLRVQNPNQGERSPAIVIPFTSRASTPLLYERAKKAALRRGYASEADDFASWYAVKILEGKCQHQTLDQAFIDYLRETRGRPGAKYCGADALLPLHRYSPPASSDTPDAVIEAGMNRSGLAAWIASENEPESPVPEDFAWEDFVSGRDLAFVRMYCADHSMKVIAGQFGVSESRVSQRLSRIIQIVKTKIRRRSWRMAQHTDVTLLPLGLPDAAQTIDLSELARRCDIHPVDISKLVSEGLIPYRQSGNQKFVLASDADRIVGIRKQFGRQWVHELRAIYKPVKEVAPRAPAPAPPSEAKVIHLDPSARQLSLSPAEKLVYDKLVKGLSNREIANQLCVTEKAVKFHLTRIYSYLGGSSRGQILFLHHSNQIQITERIRGSKVEKMEQKPTQAEKRCLTVLPHVAPDLPLPPTAPALAAAPSVVLPTGQLNAGSGLRERLTVIARELKAAGIDKQANDLLWLAAEL